MILDKKKEIAHSFREGNGRYNYEGYSLYSTEILNEEN